MPRGNGPADQTACWDRRLLGLENVAARCPDKAFAKAGDIDQIIAAIIANDQRVQTVGPGNIAADHQFLPAINPVLHPRSKRFPGSYKLSLRLATTPSSCCWRTAATISFTEVSNCSDMRCRSGA